MSVMTRPGATQFTRILSRAHSAARLLVSWFIPPACKFQRWGNIYQRINILHKKYMSNSKRLSRFILVFRNRDFDRKLASKNFSKWLSKYSHNLFRISRYPNIDNENSYMYIYHIIYFQKNYNCIGLL